MRSGKFRADFSGEPARKEWRRSGPKWAVDRSVREEFCDAVLLCAVIHEGGNSLPMKTSIAIYPGSFDPVTNGHLDLIERGEKMFDLLIVAVLQNEEKTPLFSVRERVEMLREVTKQWSDVEIDVFDGLLVDYARKKGAGVILRGIRAVSDYEYELQMALMNRKLEPRLGTGFMLPGLTYSYLSSKLVREIAQLGAPLKGLVPALVEGR